MALLPTDPAQQRKLLVGLIPALLAVGYWYFLDGKYQEQIAGLEQRLEQLEATNAAARIQAEEGGPELQRKMAIYEQHMARLEQLIPSSEEVPQLLYTLSLRAQETGVDWGFMRPEAAVPGQFYTRQTYALGIVGTYHDVGRFLTAVGSLPRIVTPTELQLRPRAPDPDDDEHKVEAMFNIETYVIPGPGETTGQPAQMPVSAGGV